jgi:TPR repeat protein
LYFKNESLWNNYIHHKIRMDSIFTQPNIRTILSQLPDQSWLDKYKQFLDENFRLGWSAQKNKDLESALKHYKRGAKQGHQASQFHLYCIYSCGQGVPINENKWKHPTFTLEADQYDILLSCYMEASDEAPIQNNLGALYEHQQNHSGALKWYKLSADQNYGPALYNLAKYYKDKGDLDQARDFFRLSGEQNTDLGWASLGDLYFGIDYEKAYHYYSKVSNNSYAQCKIGLMYERGYFVTQNYNLAQHWYKLSALQGYPVGQYALAETYMKKNKVDQAIIWYLLSAEQGYEDAQYRLGFLYFRLKNYDRAIFYFRMASKHVLAQLYLGTCYKYGYGVTIDHQEALKWWLLSAKQGQPVAQNNIGYEYLIGQVVTMDYTEAKKWFLMSATQGYITAQYHLGFLYDTGKGVDVNYYEAYDWYRLASNQGDQNAKERLMWFDDLKQQIQSYTKTYIQSHLSGSMNYLFFADLMSHLFKQLGTQPWTDSLIKRWLEEIFLEYGCESLDEWIEAMF